MPGSKLRLCAFTMRNVLTAGDTPVRVEFGRRLTLMYGENGVGKSGYEKVLRRVIHTDDEDGWSSERWYAVPYLDELFRHHMQTDVPSEVTFEYEAFGVAEPSVRSIRLRWPAYDNALLRHDPFAPPSEMPHEDRVEALLMSYAREVEIVQGDGTGHRLLVYSPWTMTEEGPEVHTDRHIVRSLANGATYRLVVPPWQAEDHATRAPVTTDDPDATSLALLRRVYKVVGEVAAPPWNVRPTSDPQYLSPRNAGASVWPLPAQLLAETWKRAAPNGPELEVDDEPGEDDDPEDCVNWIPVRGGSEIHFEALSSGEQRLYVILSHIARWYGLTACGELNPNLSTHTCVVEEPETHLHPRAQGHLLRALLAVPDVALEVLDEMHQALSEDGESTAPVEGALADPPVPAFVLETHSEAFLRAVQSALRVGALHPDDLRVNVFNRDPDTLLPSVSQAVFGTDGHLTMLWPGAFPGGSAGEPS